MQFRATFDYNAVENYPYIPTQVLEAITKSCLILQQLLLKKLTKDIAILEEYSLLTNSSKRLHFKIHYVQKI